MGCPRTVKTPPPTNQSAGQQQLRTPAQPGQRHVQQRGQHDRRHRRKDQPVRIERHLVVQSVQHKVEGAQQPTGAGGVQVKDEAMQRVLDHGPEQQAGGHGERNGGLSK